MIFYLGLNSLVLLFLAGSSNQAINLDNNIVKSTLQVERQEANQSSQVLGTASVVNDNDDRFKGQKLSFSASLISKIDKERKDPPKGYMDIWFSHFHRWKIFKYGSCSY